MRETRDRGFKEKLFLLLQIGTGVTITNGTRWSSQARARLSGESDPSKVNRGGPDCLRMCTVSQTTETGGLGSGSPSLINGSCGGSGDDRGIVYLLQSWSLSPGDLCITAVASAWKGCERSLTHGPADVGGNRPGKRGLRVGIQPGIFRTHARPPSVPHGKEFMFTSARDPLCTDSLWPLQGSRSH